MKILRNSPYSSPSSSVRHARLISVPYLRSFLGSKISSQWEDDEGDWQDEDSVSSFSYISEMKRRNLYRWWACGTVDIPSINVWRSTIDAIFTGHFYRDTFSKLYHCLGSILQWSFLSICFPGATFELNKIGRNYWDVGNFKLSVRTLVTDKN